jgi:hypothetical protein
VNARTAGNYWMNRFLLKYLVVFLFIPILASAQQTATIKGLVTDSEGGILYYASIAIKDKAIGTFSDDKGLFLLKVPANEKIILIVSHLGYENSVDTLILSSNQVVDLTIKLLQEVKNLEDVVVYGINERENTLTPINLKSIDQLPNTNGNFETILKTMPGVVSGNELSSQYSVRGGSFDENLIYVNDVEIFKPMLMHSSQQEGLSFVNPGMVSSIQFSAGGFDAQYGDKLSSVLDIKYKQPTELSGSVSASLLGGSLLINDASKNKKFTINTGLRYKTTQYLLNNMDTKGDYKPSFTDLQTYLTYDLSKKFQISFLGNYATNKFDRIPQNRETEFGSFQQSFNFTAYYEGQEKDRFDTYLGALTLQYHPNDKLSLKLIGSGFQSKEEIAYDILTEYWISLATGNSGAKRDSLINIGVGASLDHARDKLSSGIYSLEHKGTYYMPAGSWKWGLKVQEEYINDKLDEWQLLDSAGYSLPYSDAGVNLNYAYKATNILDNTRFAAYLQNTSSYDINSNNISFTLGARAQYWTYNKELTVSPRGNITLKPSLTPNIAWHLSAGLYYQPPFYNEIRDQQGNLYPNMKAQRAFEITAGDDYKFKAWGRPFIFTSEIYYKNITRLIPYKLDDVRQVYLPQYKAKGYATGIDFKIYGEFVEGTESWFSLSFLSTKEDIYNDYVVNYDHTVTYPGYYRRPTDQVMSFSLFFQDYLPTNPNYKVHLTVVYGTGLPYSGPSYNRPSDIYSLGSYRRVDIGFSRVIINKKGNNSIIKSIWITAEILNLLDTQNKVSYDWITTTQNNGGFDVTYAVPNYLTRRSFNGKITINF